MCSGWQAGGGVVSRAAGGGDGAGVRGAVAVRARHANGGWGGVSARVGIGYARLCGVCGWVVWCELT